VGAAVPAEVAPVAQAVTQAVIHEQPLAALPALVGAAVPAEVASVAQAVTQAVIHKQPLAALPALVGAAVPAETASVAQAVTQAIVAKDVNIAVAAILNETLPPELAPVAKATTKAILHNEPLNIAPVVLAALEEVDRSPLRDAVAITTTFHLPLAPLLPLVVCEEAKTCTSGDKLFLEEKTDTGKMRRVRKGKTSQRCQSDKIHVCTCGEQKNDKAKTRRGKATVCPHCLPWVFKDPPKDGSQQDMLTTPKDPAFHLLPPFQPPALADYFTPEPFYVNPSEKEDTDDIVPRLDPDLQLLPPFQRREKIAPEWLDKATKQCV
jgi:hypothetical protein